MTSPCSQSTLRELGATGEGSAVGGLVKLTRNGWLCTTGRKGRLVVPLFGMGSYLEEGRKVLWWAMEMLRNPYKIRYPVKIWNIPFQI